jgi:Flp pilus assembly pilin Flp
VLQLEYLLTWLLARQGVTSDRGASLVEYVLMLSLIATVCLAALSYFGGQSGNSLGRSSSSIVNAP